MCQAPCWLFGDCGEHNKQSHFSRGACSVLEKAIMQLVVKLEWTGVLLGELQGAT